MTRIERRKPAGPGLEVPFLTPYGYKMADPKIGGDRHYSQHAIYAETLEDVVLGLQRGLALWMKQPEKRETLIVARNLKVAST